MLLHPRAKIPSKESFVILQNPPNMWVKSSTESPTPMLLLSSQSPTQRGATLNYPQMSLLIMKNKIKMVLHLTVLSHLEIKHGISNLFIKYLSMYDFFKY